MSSPEYVVGSELPPEVRQGYIDLRQKIAAGIERVALATTRIEVHSKSDEDQKDAEGEQS